MNIINRLQAGAGIFLRGRGLLMKCEHCEEQHFRTYQYTDSVTGQMTQACMKCWKDLRKMERDAGVTVKTHTLVPAASTAIVPATEPKKIYCRDCNKEAMEGSRYCKNCGDFQDVILWWSDNYEMNQKVWSRDPVSYAAEKGISLAAAKAALWHIDVDVLRQYCTAPEEWFHDLPGAQVTHFGTDKRPEHYTFIDNKSDILFVAHLDKAYGSLAREIFAFYEAKNGEHIIHNGNLDDRIGAFIGHYLLPTQFGIKFDVLFTTNEESGGSTASDFQKDWLTLPAEQRKKYKWGVEFDRHGIEPVMYQFEDAQLKDRIEKHIKTTQGSFSDIACLDQMGCKFINWSTGYYSEHTPRHYAVLEHTITVVEAFVNFYEEFKDTHMPHVFTMRQPRSYYGVYEEDTDWKSYPCGACGKEFWSTSSARTLCYSCRNELQKKDTTFRLKCEGCSNMTETIYHKGHKLLCAACFFATLKPVSVVLDIEEGEVISTSEVRCSQCNQFTDQYGEVNGQYFCRNCLGV